MSRRRREGRSLLSSFGRTAKLFSKSRIGVLGMAVILFFVVLAVFAPELGPNNPVLGINVGAAFSIPAWARFLPGYGGTSSTYYAIPPGSFEYPANLSSWSISGQNYNLSTSQDAPPSLLKYLAKDAYGGPPTFVYVNSSIQTNVSISYSFSPSPILPYGEVFFSMSKQFFFNGQTPADFQFSTDVLPLYMQNLSAIYVVFTVQTPKNVTWTLASVQGYTLDSVIEIDNGTSSVGQWNWVNVTDSALADPENNIPGISNSAADPGAIIFNGTGTYTLSLQIQGACSDNPSNYLGYAPCGPSPSLSVLVSPINVHMVGGYYGLLGTDNEGRDVWSEFVWGSQVSLYIGILAAVGSVGIGTIVGIAGGYLGGLTDEVVGRITDFVLVLPFLPLLIILLFIITTSPAMRASIYDWIIIIFVVISWPTIGKIIRSQTLSVKERAYVEASRAVGGGTWHILRRHILPNVMGLVYSQMALSVSGFILTEAALDYLAVAIHPITTMTWGIMLTQSLADATTNSMHSYVWWWFLPPGIAIAALSVAFVLVGFALDSIFNPRLRAR
jgi:peptide/nickel transport system permease protein